MPLTIQKLVFSCVGLPLILGLFYNSSYLI